MQQNAIFLDGWDYSYFGFMMVVGSACHFVYKLLGKPFWAGLFFPTNESTFQHLKMLILPSLIFFLIQFFTSEFSNRGFFLSRFFAATIGMLGICAFFYTYTGIVGDNFIVMDIFSYFFGVAVTIVSYKLLDASTLLDFPISNLLGMIGFYIAVAFFAIFTIDPPKIGIFFDPVTKSYDPLTQI